MNRRALIAGAACIGGAVLSQQLKPHKYVSLLQEAKLDDLVSRKFGDWTSEDVGDPLALNGPGTLSAKLYNQLVTRSYQNHATGQQVMMLLAHGARQSDELQLHRPEICYPAFGFALLRNEPTYLRLANNVTLPARQLVCKSPSREESVVYWSRLGELLPIDASEQRTDRFKNALAGIIPDGVLCRFSTGDPTERTWASLEKFVQELMSATEPAGRRVLIGTERARLLDTRRI